MILPKSPDDNEVVGLLKGALLKRSKISARNCNLEFSRGRRGKFFTTLMSELKKEGPTLLLRPLLPKVPNVVIGVV